MRKPAALNLGVGHIAVFSKILSMPSIHRIRVASNGAEPERASRAALRAPWEL